MKTEPEASATCYVYTWNGKTKTIQHGLTKREWFAGLALQGALAKGYDPDFAAHFSIIATDLLIEKLNSGTKYEGAK